MRQDFYSRSCVQVECLVYKAFCFIYNILGVVTKYIFIAAVKDYTQYLVINVN